MPLARMGGRFPPSRDEIRHRHRGREQARGTPHPAPSGGVVPECPILLAPYAIADAFSQTDCARILALAAEAPSRAGGLVGGVANADLRRAELVWLDDCAGAEWVSDRLAQIVAQANREHFGFQIEDFAESAQLARYGAEALGHFSWHSDIGAGPVAQRRKLTLVVQLSAPQHYDGGGLEIWPDGSRQEAARTLGAAVVFPSFTLHRVTPVTRGMRQSLTIWAHGPAFR